MPKAENIEQYIAQHANWKEELKILRDLLTSFSIEETIKWGAPVYNYEG